MRRFRIHLGGLYSSIFAVPSLTRKSYYRWCQIFHPTRAHLFEWPMHLLLRFKLFPLSSPTHPHPHLIPPSLISYPSNTPLSFKLLNSSGSRNLLIDTSSASPFLLRVLSTKSLANACAVAGSRGRNLISLSRGSPGTILHLSKSRDTEAWPWVCIWISS